MVVKSTASNRSGDESTRRSLHFLSIDHDILIWPVVYTVLRKLRDATAMTMSGSELQSRRSSSLLLLSVECILYAKAGKIVAERQLLSLGISHT